MYACNQKVKTVDYNDYPFFPNLQVVHGGYNYVDVLYKHPQRVSYDLEFNSAEDKQNFFLDDWRYDFINLTKQDSFNNKISKFSFKNNIGITVYGNNEKDFFPSKEYFFPEIIIYRPGLDTHKVFVSNIFKFNIECYKEGSYCN